MSESHTRKSSHQLVVTYRGAYIAREITLCDRHATDTDAGMSLGPVQHGAHHGYCHVCCSGPGRRKAGYMVANSTPTAA